MYLSLCQCSLQPMCLHKLKQVTVYVNVADFKLGCQKVGLLIASATSVCVQVCAGAPVLSAP